MSWYLLCFNNFMMKDQFKKILLVIMLTVLTQSVKAMSCSTALSESSISNEALLSRVKESLFKVEEFRSAKEVATRSQTSSHGFAGQTHGPALRRQNKTTGRSAKETGGKEPEPFRHSSSETGKRSSSNQRMTTSFVLILVAPFAIRTSP